MKENISIIGLGHAFTYQYKSLKRYFNNIELCDIDENKIIKYSAIKDYHLLKSNISLIATPPFTHLNIVKDLISKNKIILEKPMVTSLEELNELIKINNSNIYSSLHYSFGREIDYFINNIKSKPIKIYSYISDNYVRNNHIKKEQINLCGSYLDEVINPISAICRMFGHNIKFIKNEKKKYMKDLYDYYSKSEFTIENINTIIEVEWNNKKSEKYIDLYYEDRIIRLDSMNQSVIDITNNNLLYKAKGNRMYNHYLGVLKDFFINDNFNNSVIMHKEVLKGVKP